MKICINKTVAFRDYGEFGVVMNIRNSRLLKLNPVGVDVWQFLHARSCVAMDDIVENIHDLYGVEKERVEGDVKNLLGGLSAAGIVRISEGN